MSDAKILTTDKAGKLSKSDRDVWLGLDKNKLGEGQGTWKAILEPGQDPYRVRTLDAGPQGMLQESLIRFPSAPVYGMHRKPGYLVDLPRLNFHTLRVLRAVGSVEKYASRIYIINNGLNELDNLIFHYRLASILLEADPDAACIIRPFPGHLWRHPFGNVAAERPLDRYLIDPGDLFRQFLRFMLETRWLLSILAPLSEYRVVSGLNLIAAGKRHDPIEVGKGIFNRWQRLREVSESQDAEPGHEIDRETFPAIVRTLRSVVTSCHRERDADKPPKEHELGPSIHAIGYSLGGFTAQASFFTWPFAVSTCTTLCSGGLLRDLALTAFAHPEEWQTVVNSLRFEIDSGMLAGRIKEDSLSESSSRSEASQSAEGKKGKAERTICGINADQFSTYYRIFYDVFVRDFAGSYQSRVSEYVERLYFVLGGSDPIVSTRSVLDASPPGGINMAQVANLPHIMGKAGTEWRDFWLPDVANFIVRYAQRGESLLASTIKENWWNEDRTDHVTKSWTTSEAGKLIELYLEPRPGAVPKFDQETKDYALASEAFQIELHRMLADLKDEKGFIFVARNEVPFAFLGPWILHHRGIVHHAEDLLWTSFVGLLTRGRILKEAAPKKRLLLVVPRTWPASFVRDQPIFSPKHEAAMFRIPTREHLLKIGRDFFANWYANPCLRVFAPDNPVREEDTDTLVTALPDAWVWLDDHAMQALTAHAADPPRVNAAVERKDEAYRKSSPAPSEVEMDAWLTSLGDWSPEDLKLKTELGETLSRLLEEDHVRMIRVSAAQFNPRFRGWLIKDPRKAANILATLGRVIRYHAKMSSAVWDRDFDRQAAK